jgi:putative membrane protein
VTVVVGKSDVYPEIVWNAFALGATLTALAATVADFLHPDWATSAAVLTTVLAILGVGGASALATVYVPAFARLFLRESRAALEVSQYAKAQFLERELFATRERTAILLLVSLLERRVVILADRGLNAYVGTAEWDAVIERMAVKLRSGDLPAAVLDGLSGMGDLLKGKGIVRGAGGRFADKPIEERGE